jgi:hypothetical protein
VSGSGKAVVILASPKTRDHLANVKWALIKGADVQWNEKPD